MRQQFFRLAALFAVSVWACQYEKPVDSGYQDEILQWRKDRLEELMAPDGWLALAGLYWLEEGPNTFGSDSSNAVVFPDKAPGFLGTFFRMGDSLSMTMAPGKPAVYEGDSVTVLALSGKGEPPIAGYGSLSWFCIRRGDKVGIRLRDAEHPMLKDTIRLRYFDIDPAWRVKADLTVFDTTYTIEVKNVLGMTFQSPLKGALQFEKDGRRFSLHALDGGEDGEFFLIFSDLTTGEATYPAGRYLYANRDSLGEIWIDFNKAYNPPCAFTKYATCLLPPAENRLEIAVTAGEQYTPVEGH